MLDARARRLIAPPLDAAARRLAAAGVPALALTGAGLLAGLAACVAIGLHAWPLALILWLVNRLFDGLDGPVARRVGATDLGGFLDIVADFAIYAGVVVALAVAEPSARLACIALLCAYYISGTAFLALSSLIERRRGRLGDERSLRFVGGLAEGTETVVVYVLFFLMPSHVAVIAWIFTGAVAITAAQRVALGIRTLHHPAESRATASHLLSKARLVPAPVETR